MLSRTAEYATRAMAALGAHEQGEAMRARELSDTTGIPQNYLSKILHTLSRAGLVTSGRGPSGGFRLGRPAENIHVLDIVDLFEDLQAKQRCFLGEATCSDETGCPVHAQWKEVRENYESFLRLTTVEDLASETTTRPAQKEIKRSEIQGSE